MYLFQTVVGDDPLKLTEIVCDKNLCQTLEDYSENNIFVSRTRLTPDADSNVMSQSTDDYSDTSDTLSYVLDYTYANLQDSPQVATVGGTTKDKYGTKTITQLQVGYDANGTLNGKANSDERQEGDDSEAKPTSTFLIPTYDGFYYQKMTFPSDPDNSDGQYKNIYIFYNAQSVT